MSPSAPDFMRSLCGAIPRRIPMPLRLGRQRKPPPTPPLYKPLPGDHRLGTDMNGTDPSRVIALSALERRAHTHIMGGSGRGKSYFLQHLIRQDFDDPDCGLCLLDPHGSLYQPLVRYIAEQRPDLAERVVLFDPSGKYGHIPGFNPIGPYAFEFPEYTLNMIVEACLKAWGQDNTNDTPRITRRLENIFAPIIVNGLTLIETAPLISTSKHSEKRRLLLAALEHDLFTSDWEEFEAANTTMRQTLLEGAGNRLRKFLSSEVIRQVLGQQEHVLDIDRIIAEKKILLVNLAPGMHLTRENSNLLGILIINEIFRAAMLRNPDRNPHPFFLYIDEFAQLITPNVAKILDECRKFGLFLTLAHQHFAQLTRENDWLFASILANCNNRFVFGGLNFEDADILARQIHTGFEDFMRVKYKEWQTKFRPVEEKRIVWGQGRTEGSSTSEQFTTAFGTSTARSRALANAISEGRSQALARSQTESIHESRGSSHTLSAQLGGQQSDTVSRDRGITRSSNWSDGKSEQETYGQSTGETHQDGTSRNRQETVVTGRSSDPYDRIVQRQRSGTEGTTDVASASDGTSRVDQSSRGKSSSHQDGGGTSLTASEGNAHSDGSSWGRGEARAASLQEGTSRSTGLTATETESWNTTQTVTDGSTDTESQTDSRGEGYSESESSSETVTVVPFHRMEEFQEEHAILWSLPEIDRIHIGEMKEQPVGVTTAKIGSAPPVRIKVDKLPPLPYRDGETDRAVQDLHHRVAALCPEFYATPEEVVREIESRQMKIFGEVIRLSFKPVKLVASLNAAAETIAVSAKPGPGRTDSPAGPQPQGDKRKSMTPRRPSGGFADDDDAA